MNGKRISDVVNVSEEFILQLNPGKIIICNCGTDVDVVEKHVVKYLGEKDGYDLVELIPEKYCPNCGAVCNILFLPEQSENTWHL